MIVLSWSIWCNCYIEVACSWRLAYKCNLAQLNADSSFACSYNHEWWPFLSSWIVKLPLSLLLIGLSKGICSSTPSRERLIGNSLIFRLGSSQCTVSSVYRFSLSLRSATAISDVARACRSKKKSSLFLLLQTRATRAQIAALWGKKRFEALLPVCHGQEVRYVWSFWSFWISSHQSLILACSKRLCRRPFFCALWQRRSVGVGHVRWHVFFFYKEIWLLGACSRISDGRRLLLHRIFILGLTSRW